MRKAPPLSEADKKFFAGFKTLEDSLTVSIQLDKLSEQALKRLKEKYGAIIPAQTKYQLLELFTQILTEK